ncbi:MAG TPA: cupin domain-containing protein [Abditibacteriaceae bacterium]|jgi:mannose-6-phosphate isomerase-like protein (cupin superfamily)
MTSKVALLPGAVGLTHLRVYNTPAPDGLHGGSPHVHFACTECYYVEKGHGRVQTLSASGYQEWELGPGGVVWFAPGVIHRLINVDGQLEILVLMQNGGLPEAGDFVLTMPPQILQNAEEYLEVASLSAHGEVFTNSTEAAERRRDLAVEGFALLRRAYETSGPAALESFYRAALCLVQPKLGAWQDVWRNGPQAAAQTTGQYLEALRAGDVSHLLEGSAHSMAAPGEERKLGMCGTLGTYLPEGVTVAATTNSTEQE